CSHGLPSGFRGWPSTRSSWSATRCRTSGASPHRRATIGMTTSRTSRKVTHAARSSLQVLRDIEVPTSAGILENRCNVGRNLSFLHRAGYRNVAGVEISPHAVEFLRETYPELADRPIHVGPAEDVLAE